MNFYHAIIIVTKQQDLVENNRRKRISLLASFHQDSSKKQLKDTEWPAQAAIMIAMCKLTYHNDSTFK